MRTFNRTATLRLFGAAALILLTVLLPRISWAASEDHVGWGLHRVELERATVVVHSTWQLHTGAAEAPVPLAAPLPAELQLLGAEPQSGPDGSVVALRLPAGAREVELTTRVPWDQVRRAGALPVPVPEGTSVHRVVIDPALSFTPDPQLGLIAQVGHYAPADIDVLDRHRFDARTDGELRNVGAYYLRGQDLERAGALRGEVALRRLRMGRAAAGAGVLFTLIVAGMVIVHRRLNRKVIQERAEAYLEQEFEHLEDYDQAFVSASPAARPSPAAMPLGSPVDRPDISRTS